MHVANIRPKKTWDTLENLIQEAIGEPATLTDNSYYTLRNNGGSAVHVVAQKNAPNGKTGEGLFLNPKEVYNYRKGENTCYLRTAGECEIHVEEVE